MSGPNEARYRESEAALASHYDVELVEHWVDVPEVGTAVRVLEAGQGDPLVFLHGSPNCAATWLPMAAHMRDRRALMIERPGSGLSAPSPRWTDHRTQSTAVVQRVLDHFDVAEADLVASSFGGLYAYNFALAHPDRTRSLTLIGSPAGPAVLGIPPIFRFISLPLPRALARKALRVTPEEAKERTKEIGHERAIDAGAIPDILFEWYSSVVCDTETPANLLGEVRAIATPLGYRATAKLRDETIAAVKVPVLYLWGDEDTFATPEQADALAALTPSATIEHFEGFGHLLWFDDPKMISDRVASFTGRSPLETERS